MTQLNGVQHQPSLHIGVSHHIPVTYSSNAIGIPFFHSSGSWGSFIQGNFFYFLPLLASISKPVTYIQPRNYVSVVSDVFFIPCNYVLFSFFKSLTW